MKPEELSRQLRRGSSRFLVNRRRAVGLSLAAKVTFDVAQAGKLTMEQWTQHRAFCLWCLAAGASFATAPLLVPEIRAARRRLLSERG